MNFLKKTFAEFSNDNCTTLAAALAYYTIFALPPLLYLLLTIVTLGLTVAYDSEAAEQKGQRMLERQAAELIGNQSATDEISAILKSDRESGGIWWKTLVSLAGIVFGATGVVAALQSSLNQVWSVKPDPQGSGIKDFLVKRLLSFAMILGLGFVLLVSLAVSAVLSAIGDKIGEVIGMSETIAYATNYVVQALVAFTIFAALFKFMPDAEITWRVVAVGAAITTVLFLIGRFVLQAYLNTADPGAQLGSAAASLAVILVWVYYTAMILLYGAEVTQVYAVEYGQGVTPQENAVRVVETLEHPN